MFYDGESDQDNYLIFALFIANLYNSYLLSTNMISQAAFQE